MMAGYVFLGSKPKINVTLNRTLYNQELHDTRRFELRARCGGTLRCTELDIISVVQSLLDSQTLYSFTIL
jgi:hypothetical protein